MVGIRIKRAVLVLWVLLVMNFVLPSVSAGTEPVVPVHKSVEAYYITEGPYTRRSSVYDYDATDQYVYLAYPDDAAVDVYDLNGHYQFSITFEHRERGDLLLQCVDNLLYVRSKYGNVFVFDGRELVEQMDSDYASNSIYTYWWFAEKTHSLSLKGFSLYKTDSSGVIQQKIQLPFEILLQIHTVNIPLCVIILLSVIYLLQRIQQKPRRLR